MVGTHCEHWDQPECAPHQDWRWARKRRGRVTNPQLHGRATGIAIGEHRVGEQQVLAVRASFTPPALVACCIVHELAELDRLGVINRQPFHHQLGTTAWNGPTEPILWLDGY